MRSLAVTTAALVAAALFACQSRDDASAPAAESASPSASAPTATSGSTTVVDRIAGVRVTCPPGWRCTDSERTGDTTMFSGDAAASAMVQEVAGAETLDEAIEKVEAIGEVIQSRRFDAPVDHPRGVVLTSVGAGDPSGSAEATTRYWTLLRDIGAHIVVCEGSAPVDAFDTFAGDIEAICASMEPMEDAR